MTQAQRKTIENEFYNYSTSNNGLWKKVVENTFIAYKWQREEQIIKMFFIDKKQGYNVRKILGISKRVFYYSINRILDTAYLWACEYHLI